jgi:hypothetical protein
MLTFSVLICVVSLTLQLPVLLNMHNWCQDIHLTSPVYFMHGGKWHVVPDQEICANTVMQNCLELDAGQDLLEGALIYRIQRKNAKSARSIQDESKCIWLLVTWHGKHTEGLYVRVLLVEHDNELDENRLRRLYQKRWPLLKAQTKSNWTLNDMTILKTTIRVMNGGYRWDIFISEKD